MRPVRAVADGVARRAAGLPATGVKPWHCQVALAVTQTAFCVGSVYLKNNLRSLDGGQVFYPIIYALVRGPGAPPPMQRRRIRRSAPAPPVRPRLVGTPTGEPGRRPRRRGRPSPRPSCAPSPTRRPVRPALAQFRQTSPAGPRQQRCECVMSGRGARATRRRPARRAGNPGARTGRESAPSPASDPGAERAARAPRQGSCRRGATSRAWPAWACACTSTSCSTSSASTCPAWWWRRACSRRSRCSRPRSRLRCTWRPAPRRSWPASVWPWAAPSAWRARPRRPRPVVWAGLGEGGPGAAHPADAATKLALRWGMGWNTVVVVAVTWTASVLFGHAASVGRVVWACCQCMTTCPRVRDRSCHALRTALRVRAVEPGA